MPNSRVIDSAGAFMGINGHPTFVGVITGNAVKNNSDTAVPFTLDAGALIMLQPDTKCTVGFGIAAALASTAAAKGAGAGPGITVEAGEKYYVTLFHDAAFLAMVPDSGTTNLKVYTQK